MKQIHASITFIFLVGFFTLSFGQDLHTPSQIFEIMEKSPVLYDLNISKTKHKSPDRSENLNTNDSYRVVTDSSILTKKYEVSDAGNKYFKKAEEYYQKGDTKGAREMYLKVLETDPSYYMMMTYVGQTYEMEKNYGKAIEWYEKTIDSNYIDYMAHWFLADAYKLDGNMLKAIDEITIAMILNRNNPRLRASFDMIYKELKLDTDDWYFNPQYKLDSTGKDQVKIECGDDWLGYAMVKALWKYEPGYSESMGVEKGSFSTREEREAFICLVPTFAKKKLKKNPEFAALQKAIDNKMVDEYIIYEVILPDYPSVAYQLTEEFIDNIKEYVVTVRGGRR